VNLTDRLRFRMADRFSALDDLREDLADTLKTLTFFKGSYTQITEEVRV
jgi:hypothetical protein